METNTITTEDKNAANFKELMQLYNKNHLIHIAMDAGFDGGKVCVNGKLYNVPFNIYDITGKEEAYKLTRIKDTFIKMSYEGGVYVLGEAAKTALLRSDNDKNVDSTAKELLEIGRYYKQNFKIALNGFVGYALYMYEKLTHEDSSLKEKFTVDKANEWHIMVGIAVPHSQRKELPDVIDEYLLEPKHVYDLAVGNKEMHLEYMVETTYYNSQAFCVFMHEALTDMCEYVDVIYKSLPALIEDGGYKTQGEFTYEKDETISGGVSNTDFAMMNINERVAQRISEYVDGYTDYMIDELCREKETIRYIDSENVSHTLDVCEIKKEETEKMAEKMIVHLCDDYNNLLKHKLIIFAGGTGQTYYPYVKEWCAEHREDIIVRLAGDNAENAFNGHKVEPVYAVVCGLFKVGTKQLGITVDEINQYLEDVKDAKQ